MQESIRYYLASHEHMPLEYGVIEVLTELFDFVRNVVQDGCKILGTTLLHLIEGGRLYGQSYEPQNLYMRDVLKYELGCWRL